MFYNNIHCSFVTLLSFFFNTEKDDMVVIHLSIYVWSTREMSRTHLNMFWIYTSPPRLTNSMLFWSHWDYSTPMKCQKIRLLEVRSPHLWHLYIYMFYFLIERLIIFTFTETTNKIICLWWLFFKKRLLPENPVI